MMIFSKTALVLCGGLLALAGPAADAAPASALEIKIELRVLDFLIDPAGRSAVAVVYDRAHAASAEEAGTILRTLQDSASLARNPIAPRLVDIHALAGLKEMKAVILTAGLDEGVVLKYGLANRTLVMSAGTACVREHRCMVGVATLPEVEIVVDRQAVADADIRFADGFGLMVKEY